MATLAALAIGLSASPPAGPAAALPETRPGQAPWRLVFADEFDGDRLDDARWATAYDRPGGMARSNWDNGEAQWYRPENIAVGDGLLRLVARREETADPLGGRRFAFTSGMITSKPSFSFRYGYMEARMKLPAGRGFWPAFWTWPRNEQWPPEIDVMEFYGDDRTRIHLTLHGPEGESASTVLLPDWTAGWHVFAVDWQPNRVTWYVDGLVRKTTSRSPDLPMYLIANLAVANGRRAPAPDAGTPFPADLAIDYIRVYARGTAATAESPVAESPAEKPAATP
ncbi:beta-glucanase (GH16 family) [Azospirillum agricola]|uniref:glycoside hydrolase family 16 protein n=1 Tax=Azospirillum agricola TaxID=1720247 RepID=UPI001AE3F8C6|nr:glycoside hydrolase family 16 protein [Azospirillum agricola]MBP2227756.1 beta-glucanase (GH16 family) [Azospirillum agricola]